MHLLCNFFFKLPFTECFQLFVTPGTVACQTPLSMEFSRQEYWRGLQPPSPGDLPNPEIEPGSPALQADSLPLSHQGSPHTSMPRTAFSYILTTPVKSYYCPHCRGEEVMALTLRWWECHLVQPLETAIWQYLLKGSVPTL